MFSVGVNARGFPEVDPFLTAAIFLELLELFERALEAAGKPVAVRAQAGEGAHLGIECEVLAGACEEGFFQTIDAIEMPGVVREGLDELLFGGALGLVFVQE